MFTLKNKRHKSDKVHVQDGKQWFRIHWTHKKIGPYGPHFCMVRLEHSSQIYHGLYVGNLGLNKNRFHKTCSTIMNKQRKQTKH